jgi:hypothetical protein
MKIIGPTHSVLNAVQFHQMHMHLATLFEKRLMFDYALLAANLKLLGEYVEVSDEEWAALRDQLQTERKDTSEPERLLLMVERLHVLSATQAEITSEGEIRLTMGKDADLAMKEATKPMPDVLQL